MKWFLLMPPISRDGGRLRPEGTLLQLPFRRLGKIAILGHARRSPIRWRSRATTA
jgi:hypothetical protein